MKHKRWTRSKASLINGPMAEHSVLNGIILTGQVPPAMIRSNDKASGIPKAGPEPCESIDVSPTDLGFSSPNMDALAEST